MEQKLWNKVLDRYLNEKTLSLDEWEQLDDYQKAVIQDLKKAFKRKTYEQNQEP